MSENAWRRKGHYKTRVLIGTSDVLESPFEDALICITGAQRNLLQNLTEYLHRRSTFVSEYGDGYYLAPTNVQWDDLQEVVADLEDKIMNCDQYTALFDAILEAAECACLGSGKGHTSPIIGPIYDDLEDDGTIEWANPVTTTQPVDDDMCALAQLVYQMAYEVLTEYVEPLQESLHEILLFLVLAALAVWLGGPLALVPGAALYHAIQAFLDAWVEGELTNTRTELMSQQEDLICAMYSAWYIGGDYAAAAAAAKVVINGSEAWSPIDKALFGLWFSPLTMGLCQTAWDEQTGWATSNVEEDACDECELEDVVGTDWWARPLWAEGNTLELYKPPNSWDYGKDCWTIDVPDEQEAVGYVLEMTVRDNQHWSRMSNWDGCAQGGTGFTPNTSETWNQTAPHFYFYAKTGEIDAAECKAALSPGATSMPSFYKCVGPQTARQGVQAGSEYVPACNITLVWKWAIFKGTSPF